jgi:hypothetical protein
MSGPSLARTPAFGRIRPGSRRPCARLHSGSAARPAHALAAAQRTIAAPADAPLLDAPTFWARAFLLHGGEQQRQVQQHEQQRSQQQSQQQSQQRSSRGPSHAAGAAAALALGAGLLALLPPGAAHAAAHGGDAAAAAAHANAAFDLAENQEFWGNVARYGRYFVTVMLGTGYVMVRPLIGLFKNPVTGVLAVFATAAFVYGVKVTLDAMLGLSQPFEYLPAQAV